MAIHCILRYRMYLATLALVACGSVFLLNLRQTNTRFRNTMPDWDDIPISPQLQNAKQPRCVLNVNELGVVQLDQSPTDLADIEVANRVVEVGGRWAPSGCAPRQHVAILIPYRDRLAHLHVLIKRLHPMLRKQKASYQIFVIEQAGNDTYNKGILFNVGIVESLKHLNFDCFIFHDVDLLPENDRNIYFCDEHLRHFSSAVNEWRYTLLYTNNAGGVVGLNYANIFRVNGYPNLYWGWGGEDDDFSARTLMAGLLLTRPPSYIGRYTMIRHKKRPRSENAYDMFATWESRWRMDGLNSLGTTNHTVLRRERHPLYTWFLVDVGKPPTVPISNNQLPRMSLELMNKFLTE